MGLQASRASGPATARSSFGEVGASPCYVDRRAIVATIAWVIVCNSFAFASQELAVLTALDSPESTSRALMGTDHGSLGLLIGVARALVGASLWHVAERIASLHQPCPLWGDLVIVFAPVLATRSPPPPRARGELLCALRDRDTFASRARRQKTRPMADIRLIPSNVRAQQPSGEFFCFGRDAPALQFAINVQLSVRGSAKTLSLAPFLPAYPPF